MLKKKTILGILAVGVTLYSGWLALSFFLDALVSIDPKISAAIIAAMTTVFVGLAAVIITQKQIKIREIENAHRDKKVIIYQKFLQTISAMQAGLNDKVTLNAPSEQELIDYLVDFKTEILLWGSPNVIKTHLDFNKASQNSGDVFLAVDNMYKAIREDMGLRNNGLNNLELVKLFLSDPEELDEIRSTSKNN